MAQRSKTLNESLEQNNNAVASPGGRRPEGDATAVAETKSVAGIENISTQVKARREPRRTFTADYKLRILEAFEACGNSLARGALLRREGLYHSRITLWRKLRDDGRLSKNGKPHHSQKNIVRVDNLSRENSQLKKKLAQAEAIIEIQKKVSELLGTLTLSTENSDEK